MDENKVTEKRRFIKRKGIWACFAVTAALLGGVTAYQDHSESVLKEQPVLVFDQGIGMGLDKEDGSLYPVDLLVADRPTGIFLQIDPDVLEDAGTISMTVTGNGETWKYTGGDYLAEQEILSFTETEPVRWESGSYHVSVEFDNGGAMEQDICFRDMKNIRVLVVPVSAPYSGELIKSGELDETLDDYTRKVYPLGDEDLEWIIYEDGELLLDDPEYDLNSTMGRYRIWKLLDDMYEEGNYDLVLGVVPRNMTPSKEQKQASVTGFTFGKAVSAISMEDISPAVTVAHEIGHCYSLGDEYENGTFSLSSNMVPYGMSGLNSSSLNEKVSGSCPYIKGGAADETQGSGTLVERENLPYDITTGTLIEQDMTSFMGLSGYPQEEYWITTDIWTTLYQKLTQEKGE